ncbi:MAG: GTP cyclohydrolase I FolE [Candidatus Latescibacterota bacterium]|nr:GTP cyclohydrolase I FolE [Candidatus Latescibacterota bacterium]
MQEDYRRLIEMVGEDPDREGLRGTPERAAKALRFLTEGYSKEPRDVVGTALFSSTMDDMIVVRDIEIYSLCEHHILPFTGHCHVGYLPDGKVIGLSKVARIVDVFARRLQIQENLTKQIAEAIEELTQPKGVGVIVEARHLCMMMRGVGKQNSSMSTSCMLGAFRDHQQTRSEFLSLVKGDF